MGEAKVQSVPPSGRVWSVETLSAERRGGGDLYLPFFRSAAMHMGIYALAAGATDPQSPHAEDEAYYVLRGCAKFTAGDETFGVKAGDLIYVRAQAAHRFHDIAEDLELLVFFSTAAVAG